MDGETAALASTAAATLVTLLATDAWAQVKKEIGGLWRRLRPAEAHVVVAELERSRDKAAGSPGDSAVIDALQAEWTARLLELLTAGAAAAELGKANSALAALLPEKRKENVSIWQIADARGSTVVQVAGDAEIGDINVR